MFYSYVFLCVLFPKHPFDCFMFFFKTKCLKFVNITLINVCRGSSMCSPVFTKSAFLEENDDHEVFQQFRILASLYTSVNIFCEKISKNTSIKLLFYLTVK